MGQSVIYPKKGYKLAILTIREHLCGFYEEKVTCLGAGSQMDTESRHRVCSGCHRITVESGLRECDLCEKEYIDKATYQNPRYETNCPRCVEKYVF